MTYEERKKYTCPYCGITSNSKEGCSNCREKLKLVRKLLRMVRNKKKEIDRSKQHESKD